jgi:tyrosyl-tRNA synthetase
MPILVGLDGQRKMSKSLGNFVGIMEPPSEMFGKLMSISDHFMWHYWDLLTDHSPEEVGGLLIQIKEGKKHPMDVKMQLAQEIVADFHGREAASKAAEKFQREIRDKQMPEDIPVVRLADEEWYQNFLTAGTESVALRWLINVWKLAPSVAEAERMIKAGAVEFNDQRITDPRYQIPLRDLQGSTLRVGKRKFKKAE